MEASAQQLEIFDIAEVAGYGVLKRREREFVRALFDGCTQREAARRAGFTGSEECIDAAASRAVGNVKVQALMNQAWARSGASVDRGLRQAAEIAARAFGEWQRGQSAKERSEARREWLAAVTFIAQVAGKLKVADQTTVTVNVVADEVRSHLDELARAGVRVGLPEVPTNAGGRN